MQLLPAVTITVVDTEQASAGAVKSVLKSAVAPGASVMGPKTGVPTPGWFPETRTPVSVTFPVFRTVPDRRIGVPPLTATAGQVSVIETPGAVVTTHSVVTRLVTELRVQTSCARPVKWVAKEQTSGGTVYVVLNDAVAPGRSVATVKNTVLGAGRSLLTTTFVSVILPTF